MTRMIRNTDTGRLFNVTTVLLEKVQDQANLEIVEWRTDMGRYANDREHRDWLADQQLSRQPAPQPEPAPETGDNEDEGEEENFEGWSSEQVAIYETLMGRNRGDIVREAEKAGIRVTQQMKKAEIATAVAGLYENPVTEPEDAGE